MWENPIYKLRTNSGKYIYVDVTKSCSPGLYRNKSIEELAEFFKSKGVVSILDFGAGALRHSLPLLEYGFDVYAVEFEEQFKRPSCAKALEVAKKNPNFTSLIFPKQFKSFHKKFDAALVCFVLPTMPRPSERKRLLKMIENKMKKRKSFIYWMSQFGKYGNRLTQANAVSDGWYLNPTHKYHTFYTEFKNAEIDSMFKKIGYNRIRVLGKSGHDQFRLYSRGGSWP